jgi:hypothetical protein
MMHGPSTDPGAEAPSEWDLALADIERRAEQVLPLKSIQPSSRDRGGVGAVIPLGGGAAAGASCLHPQLQPLRIMFLIDRAHDPGRNA